ncbi:hypothetical protein RF11_03092 [Thelohanellus kitauei]|uniref:Uncharacterized protein n=1 Tax=Thelohanellus kitauei TaxID=669202 RepID=A0A0C2J0J4_THEKT|nr:hypothetical protein RF11_03092 [Thelohanellus kitauei]
MDSLIKNIKTARQTVNMNACKLERPRPEDVKNSAKQMTVKYNKAALLRLSTKNQIKPKIKPPEPKIYHSTPYPIKRVIIQPKTNLKSPQIKKTTQRISDKSNPIARNRLPKKPELERARKITKNHHRPLTVPKPFSFDLRPRTRNPF